MGAADQAQCLMPSLIVWRLLSDRWPKKRYDGKRADTKAIIAILEVKRSEVMSKDQAGYFIHDWQAISDQVRKLIAHDFPIPSNQS
jgi:hypothetical protein